MAQNTPGNITGIDLFPGFIDKLNDNAQKLNLQSRVKGVIGSMDKLDFKLNELDLIWSEGAIYIIPAIIYFSAKLRIMSRSC